MVLEIVQQHVAMTPQHVCVPSHSVMSDSLRLHRLQAARLLCPWDFPGKNTEEGCHFVLQGASSIPREVSCISCIGRWILYHQCHLGSPDSSEGTGIQSLRTYKLSTRDGRGWSKHILVFLSIEETRVGVLKD